MKSNFYVQLAWKNLCNHREAYIPNILAMIWGMAVSFLLLNIADNTLIQNLQGGEVIAFNFLYAGAFFLIFFTVIYFYAGDFVFKARKRDMGIYSIMGLSRIQMAKMILVENAMVLSLSLILGSLIGWALGRFSFLIIGSVIQIPTPIDFSFSFRAWLATVFTQILIMLLSSLYNIMRIIFENPLQLMENHRPPSRGEKNNFGLIALGVLSLALGYGLVLVPNEIAELLENVLNPEFVGAIFFNANLFILPIILVILGTYLLYIYLGAYLLKAFKQNKKYYHKKDNFIMLSGLTLRYKKNAVSLATICLFSTFSLLALLSLGSVYEFIGEKSMDKNPYQFMAITEERRVATERIEGEIARVAEMTDTKLSKKTSFSYLQGYYGENISGDSTRLVVRSLNKVGDDLKYRMDFINQRDIAGKGIALDALEDDEVYGINFKNGQYKEISLSGRVFKVRGTLEAHPFGEELFYGERDVPTVVLSSSEVMESLVADMNADSTAEGDFIYSIHSQVSFDLDGDEEKQREFQEIFQRLQEEAESRGGQDKKAFISMDSRTVNNAFYHAAYGSAFLVGLLLAVMFFVGTATIMHFKQVSEGYDDRRYYRIMRDIGIEETVIKRSINRQVRIIFALPLVGTFVNAAFLGIGLLKTFFYQMNNVNLGLIVLLAYCIFVFIYLNVYKITSKTYYRISK